jgi:hypothetical protein
MRPNRRICIAAEFSSIFTTYVKPTGAKHDTSESQDAQSKIEASLRPTELVAVFCHQHILTIQTEYAW